MREMVFLSLGASLGAQVKTLTDGVRKISLYGNTKLIQCSSFYESAPLGGVAQNTFVNMAVLIETELSAKHLLEAIHKTENELGRVRIKKWEDRSIDIDIIFYGSHIMEEENLTIPHKEYTQRLFVLLPILEIKPNMKDPKTGRPLSEYVSSLKQKIAKSKIPTISKKTLFS